jgi:hypothetical protein
VAKLAENHLAGSLEVSVGKPCVTAFVD